MSAATAAAYAAIVAIVCAAFLVDPWAEAAFDAPKWLAVRLAALAAAFALLYRASPSPFRWSGISRRARVALCLLAFAGACALLATLRSAHGVVAWSYLLAMSLGTLWLFVGASRALDAANGGRVLRVFIAVTAVTAIVSLLQILGMPLPFELASLGGRYASGALLGNEGYVALACALMGACGIALLCATGVSHRTRAMALAATLLAVATIAINRQATSAAALLAATIAIFAIRFGRRWIVAALAGGLALLFVSAAVPTLRNYTWASVPGADAATYQRVTTYRLGAWVAALEMIESKPWIGHGPGAFSEESTARRMAAEPRLGARFVQPLGATFVAAHQEPLQAAAELGSPAAIAIALAFAIVYFGVVGGRGRVVDVERLVLCGLLSVGAVSALAWFPLQIPLTAVALLIASGRAWRLCANGSENGHE